MRTIAYIDGFNLFYGLKDSGLKHCYWLDLRKLVSQYLEENWNLVGVNYFTAVVINNEDKRIRQGKYLDALRLDSGIKVILGNYQNKKTTCAKCGKETLVPKEKKTDVNIASQMIIDAYENACDSFVLISGDTDLVPPLVHIKTKFPNKKIKLLLPPKAFFVRELVTAAHFNETINKTRVEASLLPKEIAINETTKIGIPEKWKMHLEEFEGRAELSRYKRS